MDIVVLLPGQGSQRVGMGKDLYAAHAVARDTFRAVDDAIGMSLSTLAFDGPADELTKTHHAQPALLAHSAAVWAIVRDAIAPSVRAAAGHSLGEFSAYHIAGMFDLPDVARVVRQRGLLMYEQGVARPGAMAAILGVLSESIGAICETASATHGLVVPANYNSPEQVVISGEVAGVEQAMALCKAAGAKRCLPLPVSGAFHSPLMAPAVLGLEQALSAATRHVPRVPVAANVTGELVTDRDRAQALLLQQLTAPVRWTTVIEELARQYPDALYVEMGTGSVLSGLVRRIAPQLKTMSCGTTTEVDHLLSLAGAHV
ncbi:MAG: ACP S-malonyltransferase [Gemmatimonadaceae bacterium]|nr:ACP S-malonyltransferase [Gemmatimonadaceae bacterium]